MTRWLVGLSLGLAALTFGLAACSASGASGSSLPGDAARGKATFQQQCASCHRTQDVEGGPGTKTAPDLSDIGATGGRKVPGQDAATFIKESIVNPSAYVEPGFKDNLMPKEYRQRLGDATINDLVAYLLGQKSPPPA